MAVPGSVVGIGKLITPGGQQGPKGDAGTAANVPLADITQNGLLRQNTGKTTDFVDGTNNCQPIAPVIWSARLRSYNSVSNPSFEVNQRNGSTVSLVNPANGTWLLDRWKVEHSTVTAAVNIGQASTGANPTLVPGTNFPITNSNLQITLTTAQATLAAGDYYIIDQAIEGPMLRELISDVHSISLLVYSTVANLKFGLILRDNANTHSLTKLCTISNANTWTIVTLPNIPVWSSGATWSTAPGTMGYQLLISLACGSTYMSPANDTWQNSSFLGAAGMSNWLASPVNSNLYFAFVQHEPGPLCTTVMDKLFTQNLDECLRYYQKSYPYGVLAGSITGRYVGFTVLNGSTAIGNLSFHKTMAKTPTLTCYNASTGTINQCYQLTAPSNPYQAAQGTISDSGMGSMLNGAANFPTVGAQVGFFYTADTGW